MIRITIINLGDKSQATAEHIDPLTGDDQLTLKKGRNGADAASKVIKALSKTLSGQPYILDLGSGREIRGVIS